MKERILTTAEIARMLKLNPTTINKYVDDNQLTAFRTPGGHRRVRESDFLRFLKKFSIPVPLEITRGERMLKVQLIDDDHEFTKWLQEELVEVSKDIFVHFNNDSYTGLMDISIIKPDILVLDYFMPHLDGAAFLKKFKNHERFQTTDVVVVSGYPKPDIETEVLGLGARAFFTKPLDLDEFCKFIFAQYEVDTRYTDNERSQVI